jgi:hypothetical protein
MDSFLKFFVGLLLGISILLLSGVVYFFLEEVPSQPHKQEVKKTVENPVKKSISDNQEAVEKSYADRQERIEALKEVGRELSGN